MKYRQNLFFNWTYQKRPLMVASDSIRIHRIRARLFSARNVGPNDDNSLNLGNLTECDRRREQVHCRYAPSGVPD
ncbi:MAG TPA: hypothetical protein VIW07_16800 [Candidatus Udaeobacter sp.]